MSKITKVAAKRKNGSEIVKIRKDILISQKEVKIRRYTKLISFIYWMILILFKRKMITHHIFHTVQRSAIKCVSLNVMNRNVSLVVIVITYLSDNFIFLVIVIAVLYNQKLITFLGWFIYRLIWLINLFTYMVLLLCIH